jgi:hypothetical protein
MKRMTAVILMIACLLLACGKIKTMNVPVLEGAGEGPDTSTYAFESLLDGFGKDGVSDNVAFNSISITTEKSYLGTGCIKINAAFTGVNPKRGGTIGMTGTTLDFTGKTLTAYVWVPNSMTDTSNKYGATFYIQLADNDWYQSTWQNLEMPDGNIAGKWNKVVFNVNDMTLANGSGAAGHINGATVLSNGANVNSQQKWGLKLGMGDSSATYTGTMYVDSLNIE